MTIPFGKHQGSDTSDPDVPIGYLIWLEQQDWIKDDLREALNEEISIRTGNETSRGRQRR